MILQDALLVMLVKLVDRLPMLPQPSNRGRGHPIVYTDRLVLKALVIMIVRHLQKVNELRSRLAQPTTEMAVLRAFLHEQGSFPSRRTWERRQISHPTDAASADWLLGPPFGGTDSAAYHERTCRGHR
jgi:hypothetical protein